MDIKKTAKTLAEEAWRMLPDECKEIMGASLKKTFIESLTEDIIHGVSQPSEEPKAPVVQAHWPATLKRVGDEPSMMVYIEVKGDPSVGIFGRRYEMVIPNSFSDACDDEECSEWVEDARREIYNLYATLEAEGGIHIWFGYEWNLQIAAEDAAAREDEEWLRNNQ